MVAQEIRRRGWRQCSIAAATLRDVLSERLPEATADDLLLLITHDCSIVSDDFEEEPEAELLLARAIPAAQRDGNYFEGKSPRRLQFEADGRLFQIRSRERIGVDRKLLAAHDPDPNRELPENVRDLLPAWMAKRYRRAVLPDAFNARTKDARKKIRKLLEKDGEIVTALFIALEREDELSEGEPYVAFVTVTAASERVDDGVDGPRLERLRDLIEKLLSESEGVEVASCELLRESEFTLEDLKRSIEWDVWDDLSYRPQ